MLARDLSLAEATVITLQQNSSLFLLLMMADLSSDSIVNSSLSKLVMTRSRLLLTLGSITTDLNELNGTALNSLDLYSLRTEDQVSATIMPL